MLGNVQYKGPEDILDKATPLRVHNSKDGWELCRSSQGYKLDKKDINRLVECLTNKWIVAKIT